MPRLQQPYEEKHIIGTHLFENKRSEGIKGILHKFRIISEKRREEKVKREKT